MTRARLVTSLTCLLLLIGEFLAPRPTDGPRAADSDSGRTAARATASAPSRAGGPTSYSGGAGYSGPVPPVPTTSQAPQGVFLGPPLPPASVSSTPSKGTGSTGKEIDPAQGEILHTDRLLAVLKPKIYRAGSGKALERFQAAVKRQREARTAMTQHATSKAERLTREARSLAREASVMVGPPEEDPAYVNRAVEHAYDALSVAEDVLEGGAPYKVWYRYNGLKATLDSARAFCRMGEWREAHLRATSVRDGVLDILEQTNGLPVPEDTASKALKRAEQAVERAGQELGDHPSAPVLRLRREAMAQLGKAKVAFARKDYRDTVIRSKLVERSLDQAVTAQRGTVKPAA